MFFASSLMRLKWDIEPDSLDYDPILVNCFEGLQETDHPYCFVAFQALKKLLTADCAATRVTLFHFQTLNQSKQ